MNELIVHDTDNTPIYRILLEESFEGLVPLLHSLDVSNRKLCVVSDSVVGELYGKTICEMLKEAGFFSVLFTFPAGEASKNLSTVEGLYDFLIANSFDRNDVLLALGGGVTGDLTGFAAATYLRGIRFVGIPTSLLSMVDSSIGGKTGVDFKAYKNMVGAFYQPSAVYINVNALKTLSEREFLAGMGEVVKHGFIRDFGYYTFLKEQRERILGKDTETLRSMVYRSLCIKKAVVERDPKERGERALLNFGHTIGHAVEKLSNFSMLHGECVSVGMIAAAELSVLRGTLSKEDASRIREMLSSYGMRTKVPALGREDLLSVCHRDKKSDGSKIKFILLDSIGNAFIDSEVSDEEIWTAFQAII
ncbi:MAG: 3-dehydroquinate synthase [Lachnospiraceae bacterium]|nr:3-dehydroquinate synthase [Lachnospiraceae bacterium]